MCNCKTACLLTQMNRQTDNHVLLHGGTDCIKNDYSVAHKKRNVYDLRRSTNHTASDTISLENGGE